MRTRTRSQWLLLAIWAVLWVTTLSVALPTAGATASTIIDLKALPGDGHLYTSGADWNVIHGQDTALIDNVSPRIYVDSTWDGSKFKNSRGILFFNPVGSATYTSLSQVHLHFYADAKTATATDSSIVFFSTTGTAHPNYPLQQSDYNIDHYISYPVGTIDCSTIVVGQYNIVTLPVGFWLSNSIINIVAVAGIDYTGEAPTGANTVTIASADSAHPPYLSITYSTGTTAVDTDLQDIEAKLDAVSTLLGTVVDNQNNLAAEMTSLRTSLGAMQQTTDPTLLSKVDSMSKSLSSLQQQETEQNKNITSILNQVATIPPLRTNLAEAVTVMQTLSNNVTAYTGTSKSDLDSLRESVKQFPMVVIILILVLVLCVIELFILLKLSRSAI
jgi:hypothetical protein